jgi:hypothetical protein
MAYLIFGNLGKLISVVLLILGGLVTHSAEAYVQVIVGRQASPTTGHRVRGPGVNPHLELLLSPLYAAAPLISEHLADLRASGLTDETVAGQKLRTVPPAMLPSLLGFDIPEVRSAYLIPFPDPRGGWMDHVRMKVFPPYKGRRGDTVKYLQPRGSGVRLFFPLARLDAALHSDVPLWCTEGRKRPSRWPRSDCPPSASPGSTLGTVQAPPT